MNNFLFPSSFHQSLAMWAVMKFYHMLRSGISWKINETIIELWHNSYDLKTSTTHSYCEDDTTNDDILNIDANKNESYLIDGNNRQCRKRIPQVVDNEDDCDSLSEHDDSEGERQIGDGNAENDLFLTSLDATVFASVVWQ